MILTLLVQLDRNFIRIGLRRLFFLFQLSSRADYERIIALHVNTDNGESMVSLLVLLVCFMSSGTFH